MYGVFNIGTFTFIIIAGCFLFQFQVMKFFPCRNLITLIRLLTAIFIWCDKALYTITDKDVDNNTLMLRMFFRNLPFSWCWFCSSVSITKRAIFLFNLYVPFRVDTLTLPSVGIIRSFLHNFINAMSASNFSNFVFFCSKSLTTLIKSCPYFFLICLKILFRAHNFIIKGITRRLIILKKPRKMTNYFFNNYIFVHTFSGSHQSV